MENNNVAPKVAKFSKIITPLLKDRIKVFSYLRNTISISYNKTISTY